MRPEVVRAITWTLVAVAVAFYLAARLTVAHERAQWGSVVNLNAPEKNAHWFPGGR